MKKLILMLALMLFVSCNKSDNKVSEQTNSNEEKETIVEEVEAEPEKYTDENGNFIGVSHVIAFVSQREEKVISLNEKVKDKDYDFTITGYKVVDTFKNKSGEKITPEEGYSFLVADVEIKNNTEKPKMLFPEPIGAKMQNINGYIFNGEQFYLSEFLGLAESEGIFDPGLKSGETTKGQVVFVIEKEYAKNPINCILFVTDDCIYTLKIK